MSEAARTPLATSDGREPARATMPRELWAWVWLRIRPWVGWALALLGGLALFLGWYGVSGEALTAKQLPYLVSGGLTGIGLIVLAGAFLATDDIRRQLGRVDDLERKVDELHALFAVELAGPLGAVAADARPGEAGGLVALPTGASYHRADCALVAGKGEAAKVDARAVRQRGLRACRVCDPPAAA